MLAKDVMKVFNDRLTPLNKELGFKRSKSFSNGYQRMNTQEKCAIYWMQFDKWGFDKFFGSRFTVEFQLSDQDKMNNSFSERKRFGQLLCGEILNRVNIHNQRVIGRLREQDVPVDHPALIIANPLTEKCPLWPRNNYRYDGKDDCWIHYIQPEDVDAASTLVVAIAQYIAPRIMNLKSLDLKN